MRTRAFAFAQLTPAPTRPIQSEESADDLLEEIGHSNAAELMGSAACTSARTRQQRACVRRWAFTFEDGAKITRPNFGPSSKALAAG
jgi:hypothetical protein